MKKVLLLLAPMVFVVASGMAFAEDVMPGSKDTGDEMIRNEDLKKYEQEQSQGTVNQMPSAVPGAGGSAAGGSSGEADSSEKDETAVQPDPLAPMEKKLREYHENGGKNPYEVLEKQGGDVYRY